MALIKSISNISFGTGAGWHVIDDRTVGIDPTGVGARIHALVPLAGGRSRAVGVQHALWPAAEVRVTEQTVGAGTGTLTGAHSRACTRPTGAGLAEVRSRFRNI